MVSLFSAFAWEQIEAQLLKQSETMHACPPIPGLLSTSYLAIVASVVLIVWLNASIASSERLIASIRIGSAAFFCISPMHVPHRLRSDVFTEDIQCSNVTTFATILPIIAVRKKSGE